jgi:hypothetical protein
VVSPQAETASFFSTALIEKRAAFERLFIDRTVGRRGI